MKNLIFRKAINNEYKDCFNLVKNRIEWMNKNNFKHWNNFPYLEIFPLDYYKDIQEDGVLYVLIDNDEIVCFAALLNKDERWLNGNDNNAIYLHHFTSKISPNKYGQKFLYRVYDYALSQNKKYIRLDANKNYKPLDRYYASLGFVDEGECKEGEYVGTLKELTLVDKKTLRKVVKDIKLNDSYKKESSLIIQNKVLESKEYLDAKNIFVYLSTEQEVSTDLIIQKALKEKKNVFVPKCDEDKMRAILINEDSEFIKNQYQILEPQDCSIEAEELDLAIIPCLSSNNSLRRLGHGKGYYDKFLDKHECLKWVLCFKEKEMPYIPMDNYDIYMDKLIDEKS